MTEDTLPKSKILKRLCPSPDVVGVEGVETCGA